MFLGALVAAAVVVFVFRGALQGELLEWDDHTNFVENTNWRGLAPANLAWMLTTFHHGPYQPLSWFTFGVDYALSGFDPVALHRTNLVFHAAATAAFFGFAHAFTRAAFPAVRSRALWIAALCAALFFGAHPLRVESVAWVTERRDVVSGLFYVLTLWFWTRHVGAGGTRWRRDAWLACACFVLALLGKGTGMLLPFALFAFDWAIPRRTESGERVGGYALVVEKLPFLALGFVFAGVALYGQYQTGGTLSGLEHYGLGGRVLQTIVGSATYPAQTALLLETAPFHPHPPTLGEFALADFVPVLVLALVLGCAYVLRVRGVIAAWLAFVIVALPILGFAQAGPQLTADRYTYLSCMPFALLAGAGIAWASVRSRAAGFAVATLGLALCGYAAVRAHTLVPVWRDDAALWRRATVVHPKALIPWRKLSVVLTDRAKATPDRAAKRALLVDAVETCRDGLTHVGDPGLANNAMFAAAALAELEPARASEHLELALKFSKAAVEMSQHAVTPSLEAEVNYARLLIRMARLDEARTFVLGLVARHPSDVDSAVVAGQVHARLKRWDEATLEFERALKLGANSFDVWFGAGEARRNVGRPDDALAAFRRAIELGTQPGAAPGVQLDVARLHVSELEGQRARTPRR